MPEAFVRNTLRFVLLAATLLLTGESLLALSCNVVQPHSPSDAEKAFLAADYAKAASEYQTGLATHPGDAEMRPRMP
jgi:hypothetical protein